MTGGFPLKRLIPAMLLPSMLIGLCLLADQLASPPSQTPHNCRFWGCVSRAIPGPVLEGQLRDLPHSLEALSSVNRDGWALVTFVDGEPEPRVRRGEEPAHLDPDFGLAVAEAAGARPRVAVSHIRFCSSGLCDIPNPHPFERVKNGRHWFMGHNGTIAKDILIGLIRPDYLAANPPRHGVDASEWIDSELFFLYLLQTCESCNWEIESALGSVIRVLRLAIPSDHEQLNFVLTDGHTLWAYREGLSLYYLHRAAAKPRYSAVASQFPGELQEDWVELLAGQLVTLSANAAPVVVDIESWFHPTATPGTDHDLVTAAPVLRQNYPNPFNPSTSLRFTLPEAARVRLEIYDLSGRKLATLLDARLGAGEFAETWDGRDRWGRELGAGIYLARLETERHTTTGKMILIK